MNVTSASMECFKKTKERWTIEAFFVNVFLHPLKNPRQCKKPFIGLQLVVMWFIHEGNNSHNPSLQADNPYITSNLWSIPGHDFFEKKCKAFKSQALAKSLSSGQRNWADLSGKRNLLLPGSTWEFLRTRWNVSVCSRSNWNLEVLVFKERGEPKYPEKTSRSKGENQQHTQPHRRRQDSNPGHTVGTWAWWFSKWLPQIAKSKKRRFTNSYLH